MLMEEQLLTQILSKKHMIFLWLYLPMIAIIVVAGDDVYWRVQYFKEKTAHDVTKDLTKQDYKEFIKLQNDIITNADKLKTNSNVPVPVPGDSTLH